MPYKGGVQLLPETQRRPTLASYTSGNGYFWFGVVLGAFVLVAGAILGGYAANLEDRIAALDGQLTATEEARNKEQERILLDVQKQSRIMRQLLAAKLYWSQAFAGIEQMTQSSVRLTRLDGSASKGTIGFRAVADNYAAVARQLKAFTDGTGVNDLSVKTIKAAPQGGVEFDGELLIDVKKLLNKE